MGIQPPPPVPLIPSETISTTSSIKIYTDSTTKSAVERAGILHVQYMSLPVTCTHYQTCQSLVFFRQSLLHVHQEHHVSLLYSIHVHPVLEI